MKILLADDDNSVRRVIQFKLKKEGFDVTAVEDGPSALALLKEKNVDLMLLDIRMPGMDGIAVMQQATEISPDTQIVMLTAHGSM